MHFAKTEDVAIVLHGVFLIAFLIAIGYFAIRRYRREKTEHFEERDN